MRSVLLLAFLISILLLGCVQKPEVVPKIPTVQPTKTSSKVYGKEILKTELTPEEAIKKFLPDLDYPWRLIKSNENSALSTMSEVPRIPEVAFNINISANIGGFLATPLVENGKIFLADGLGVYALNESNGELIWGAEIYSDTLEGRKISEPHSWTKWKAFGFYRFVVSYGVGKYVFVGTSSSEVGGNGYVLALDKENGELVWKVELKPESNVLSAPSVTSNLLVIQDKVCVGTARDEGYVFCFTEDGKLLWRNKINGNVRGLAYGNEMLFATSEPSKFVHAFDIKTGEKFWTYAHDSEVSAPIYKNGKVFFIDSTGQLVALSSKGEIVWKKNIGGGSDVNTNPYLAVGNTIYAARNLGERPLNLYVINFDGDITGEFKLEENERAGTPVVTKNVVILPVASENYGKIYFLWKGVNELYEFKFKGDEIYMPKVSVAHGNVYAVFSYDRANHTIIKFEDSEKPEIKRVEEIKRNGSVDIKALIQDKQSGIHKALVAYNENSEWHYVEMELARRYVMEPIGGYGFSEEEYIATIPKAKYVVIAIDNTGNYVFSLK